MAYKWLQWLKDYNDNKIKLCVPVGYSAQEAADDPDNSVYLSYQGWQPPSYTHWDIFPLHIAIAENCVNYARNNGCEDVVRYLSSFGVGAELQYHFKSNETITSRCNSVDYLGYSCSFFQPSAGLDVYSYASYISTNPDNIAFYRYPAIAIDEDTHRAIFAAITVTKTYSDPDPSGSVNIEILTRTDAARATFYNKILTSIPPVPADPYDAGGNSNEQLDTGPATGNFDDSSDTISQPSLPSLNIGWDTDLIHAWVPDKADLDTLAHYLYSNFDHLDPAKDLSKLFADPRDGVIALFMLPFEPGKSLLKTQVSVGNFPVADFEMYWLSQQFKEVSCGSVTISEYYGNYLDYNPYTRITLFLPYVGEVQLDPDEVMGETVAVNYVVDCLTGAFVVFVKTSTKILAQYQGNCAVQIPVTSADFSRINSAILQAATAAVGLGAAVVTGGASEVLAAAGGMGSAALGIQQSKVTHSHSGALGGAAGFVGSQTPYLIIHRARQSVPPNANEFRGYPCNATFRLGDLKGCGFTKVHDIILDNMGGYTDDEIRELREILAGGVFL